MQRVGPCVYFSLLLGPNLRAVSHRKPKLASALRERYSALPDSHSLLLAEALQQRHPDAGIRTLYGGWTGRANGKAKTGRDSLCGLPLPVSGQANKGWITRPPSPAAMTLGSRPICAEEASRGRRCAGRVFDFCLAAIPQHWPVPWRRMQTGALYGPICTTHLVGRCRPIATTVSLWLAGLNGLFCDGQGPFWGPNVCPRDIPEPCRVVSRRGGGDLLCENRRTCKPSAQGAQESLETERCRFCGRAEARQGFAALEGLAPAGCAISLGRTISVDTFRLWPVLAEVFPSIDPLDPRCTDVRFDARRWQGGKTRLSASGMHKGQIAQDARPGEGSFSRFGTTA